MTLTDVLSGLRQYCPSIPFVKYLYVNAPDPENGYIPGDTAAYGVISEVTIEKMVFDGIQREELLEFSVDCFLYDDQFDDVKAMVESFFDLWRIAFDFESVMFENEAMLHLTWTCTAAYGLGTPVTRKKEIHDTNETIVAGYDLAQVVDPNLIAQNIRRNINVLGIVGEYGGGGGVYEEKTVHGTLAGQTVLPSSGYDALSKCIIEAVPVEIIPNTHGNTLVIGG